MNIYFYHNLFSVGLIFLAIFVIQSDDILIVVQGSAREDRSSDKFKQLFKTITVI